MVKYFSISGMDNDSEFYYNNDALLKYCSSCGLIINRAEAIAASISSFRLKKKNYTLSFCWDGPAIASEKFVEIVRINELKGLSFIHLPNSEGYYLVKIDNLLHYDFAFNPYLFLKEKCSLCGQWYEVAKIRPIKVIDSDEQKMESANFYRTDLEYGEKVRRAPLFLATENIPDVFKKEKIKDVFFEIAGKEFIIGNPKANEYK